MWPFTKQGPEQWRLGMNDGSPGALRREELTCLRHKQYHGQQVSDSTVRWECKCGAYQEEIDAPPPPPGAEPTGDYLEMQVRGTQGQASPWRSQVTDDPLPKIHQETARIPAGSGDVPAGEVSTTAQARARLADVCERTSRAVGKSAQARMDLGELIDEISSVSQDSQTLAEVIGTYQQAMAELEQLSSLLLRAERGVRFYGTRLNT